MSTPVFAEEPQVGDIFDIDPGTAFRGWLLTASGLGMGDAPYSIFEKNNEYLIALESAVVRSPRGGISVKKITQILRVKASADETHVLGHDCTFAGMAPAIAFYSKATGIARGYFAFRDAIRLKRWMPDNEEPCEYSGD